MKILLVRPPRIKQAITLSNFMFSEPLGLEMIYSVFEQNHTVEIFDMMIEKLSIEELKFSSPLGEPVISIKHEKIIRRVHRSVFVPSRGTCNFYNKK